MINVLYVDFVLLGVASDVARDRPTYGAPNVSFRDDDDDGHLCDSHHDVAYDYLFGDQNHDDGADDAHLSRFFYLVGAFRDGLHGHDDDELSGHLRDHVVLLYHEYDDVRHRDDDDDGHLHSDDDVLSHHGDDDVLLYRDNNDLHNVTHQYCTYGGDSSGVDHQASDRKVVGLWFDFRTEIRRCVCGKDTLCLFPLGTSSLLIVVAQPDEKLANRTQKSVLCWYGG